MNQIPAVSFLEKLTQIPEHQGIRRKLVLALRVILVSIHRFKLDDCLVKASGLAYTTIVTLVPTLTVAFALLTVAQGAQKSQDEIFQDVNGFLLKNNIQFDIAPYWETLSDIISTASQIGAIGFIVFIFSATAVLRSLEKTFHDIWRIDSHRSFINKFVFYFFLITFGPLLFVVGLGFSDKITDSVRSAHLKSIVITDDGKMWVAGEKGNIGIIKDLKDKITYIRKDSVDYENMFCVDIGQIETGTCKKPNIYKENFFRIRAEKKSLFAISEEGTLLQSSDSGNSWKLHSFKNISVSDFGVSNDDTVFILTNDTRTLRYNIGKSLQEVKQFNNKDITPVKIRFFSEKDGFILDREGRLWKSNDGGNYFNSQVVSQKTLNDIFFLNRELGFVVGDNGAIFRTHDGGVTWVDINHKKYSYTRVWAFASTNSSRYDLFVLNRLGDILSSNDEGETWSLAYKPKDGDLFDLIHLPPKEKIVSKDNVVDGEALNETEVPVEEEVAELNSNMLGIIGVGEYNKIIKIENDDKGNPNWKKYQGGLKFFSLYSLLQILLPLLAIWIFFIILFTIIPNTKVPMRASFIGAAITGIIIIVFFWGFLNIYITSFSEKTMIIYKALAAIPIFLLTIYSVGAIVLFGAEITATLQFPDRYLLPVNPLADSDGFINHEFYETIKFLSIVYENQEKKGKLISITDLKQLMVIPERDINQILENLQKADFISVSAKNKISPVMLREQVTLLNLYENTVTFSFAGPTEIGQSFVKASKELQEIDTKIKAQLKAISLKDLIS